MGRGDRRGSGNEILHATVLEVCSWFLPLRESTAALQICELCKTLGMGRGLEYPGGRLGKEGRREKCNPGS